MSDTRDRLPPTGLAGRIAQAFIDSKLTPLVVIVAVLLGLAAIVLLPREEEPQIKVPMVDVMVNMAGFSAKEVEERATRPMEKLLWEIPGVEYIYSTSRDSESLVIVRFKVGSDPQTSLVALTEKLRSNFDRIPHGVAAPLVKPKSIDDVPILALTFHSTRYDHLTLRRLVAEVDDAVKAVPLVAETTIIGGIDFSDSPEGESKHEVILAELHPEADRLPEIDAALQRLRDGTYGVCEATGERISPTRLRAIPWTRYSRPATERRS